MRNFLFICIVFIFTHNIYAQKCQVFYQEGITLYDAGNFAAALKKFQEGKKQPKADKKCPDLTAWIARTEQRLAEDRDTDKDGVSDSKDKCPTEKGDLCAVGCPPAMREYSVVASGQNMGLRLIDAGTFYMGSTEVEAERDERNVHLVYLNAFYISKYEVTVGQYLAFCRATNKHWPIWLEANNQYNILTGASANYYKEKGYSTYENEQLPITGISWNDAEAFCQWLSAQTGRRFRLPTEAEWEYAARGGASFRYSGSDNVAEVAWFADNSGAKPQPVGQKKPNNYGLYDMSGNVWEWCADLYEDYGLESLYNPTGGRYMSNRVFRGGSWNYPPVNCRVSDRAAYEPTFRHYNLGFRVVCMP